MVVTGARRIFRLSFLLSLTLFCACQMKKGSSSPAQLAGLLNTNGTSGGITLPPDFNLPNESVLNEGSAPSQQNPGYQPDDDEDEEYDENYPNGSPGVGGPNGLNSSGESDMMQGGTQFPWDPSMFFPAPIDWSQLQNVPGLPMRNLHWVKLLKRTGLRDSIPFHPWYKNKAHSLTMSPGPRHCVNIALLITIATTSGEYALRCTQTSRALPGTPANCFGDLFELHRRKPQSWRFDASDLAYIPAGNNNVVRDSSMKIYWVFNTRGRCSPWTRRRHSAEAATFFGPLE